MSVESLSVSCSLCDSTYAKYKRLKKHFQKRHSEYDIRQCPLCEFVSLRRKELKKHRKTSHPLENQSSNHCDFPSNEQETLDQHNVEKKRKKKIAKRRGLNEVSSEEDLNQCSVKGKTSEDYGNGEVSSRKKHPKQKDKKKKKKSSKNHSDSGVSSQKEHGQHNFQIEICEDPNIDGEVGSLHAAEIPEFVPSGKGVKVTSNGHKHSAVPITSQTEVTSNGDLERTVPSSSESAVTSDGEPNHTSSISGLTMNTSKSSKTSCHAATCLCGNCERSFSRYSNLVRHGAVHAKENLFKCDVCSFSTKHDRCLDLHRFTHQDEKPFPCNQCEKSFSKKISLIYHLRTHSGERPFQCQYCEYSAAQKVNLDVHLRSHLQVKPYTCKFCDFSTAYHTTLLNHEKVHTDVREFTCKVCEKKFKRKAHLKRHVLSIHKMRTMEI